jgi:hypothetical protein
MAEVQVGRTPKRLRILYVYIGPIHEVKGETGLRVEPQHECKLEENG